MPENTSEDSLRRSLEAAAVESKGRSGAMLAEAAFSHVARRKARVRAGVLMAGGLGLGVAVGTGLMVSTNPDTNTTTTSRQTQLSDPKANGSIQAPSSQGNNGAVPLIKPGAPCPGAVHGSIAKIARVSGQKIILPTGKNQDPLDAWLCPGDSSAFVLTSDTQYIFDSSMGSQSAMQNYVNTFSGTFTSVDGRQVGVIPAQDSTQRTEVMVVAGGALIKLLSTNSSDELLDDVHHMDLS